MNQLVTKINTLDINNIKKKKRPTFYTRSNKEIRAGGVLFVKDGKYLLQKKPKNNSFQYSDFGGKTDVSDNDIIDTIIREVKEETNNQIILTRNQLNKAKKKYITSSKYLLFIIKTKKNFKKQINQMGNQEMNSDIIRTIQWCKPNYNDYHIRLKTYFQNKKQ